MKTGWIQEMLRDAAEALGVKVRGMCVEHRGFYLDVFPGLDGCDRPYWLAERFTEEDDMFLVQRERATLLEALDACADACERIERDGVEPQVLENEERRFEMRAQAHTPVVDIYPPMPEHVDDGP